MVALIIMPSPFSREREGAHPSHGAMRKLYGGLLRQLATMLLYFVAEAAALPRRLMTIALNYELVVD